MIPTVLGHVMAQQGRTAVVVTLIVGLVIIFFYGISFRPRHQARSNSSPKTPPAVTYIRVKNIPLDTSVEGLESKLNDVLKADPGLEKGVKIIPRSAIPCDRRWACAVVTLQTSIQRGKLLKGLECASSGTSCDYIFDADFHDITPLYEPEKDARAEYEHLFLRGGKIAY